MNLAYLNNGVIFYPEERSEVKWCIENHKAVMVEGGGYVPEAILKYYAGMNEVPLGSGVYEYSYLFSYMTKYGIYYNIDSASLSPIPTFIKDTYCYVPTGANGYPKWQLMVSYPIKKLKLKPIPIHSEVFYSNKLSIEDTGVTKSFMKDVQDFMNDYRTDKANNDATIKALVLTIKTKPCANGSPLNPAQSDTLSMDSDTTANDVVGDINSLTGKCNTIVDKYEELNNLIKEK